MLQILGSKVPSSPFLLSYFLQFYQLMTPANTPATPPNFPETLLSFNKLSTSPVNDHQSSSNPSTTNANLSSSPMNLMMDGTAQKKYVFILIRNRFQIINLGIEWVFYLLFLLFLYLDGSSTNQMRQTSLRLLNHQDMACFLDFQSKLMSDEKQ